MSTLPEEAVKAAAQCYLDRTVSINETASSLAHAMLTAALPFLLVQGAVKKLEWVDADEGMRPKWRAAALGGRYEVVYFYKDEPGFAVNFHWGRPFSFWFIQGEPDEWGITGPKIFPTIKAAKAAAQADYEARILSALEPAATCKESLQVAPEAKQDGEPEDWPLPTRRAAFQANGGSRDA
ncbi:hypothetical protein L3V16_06060 [Brucella ciceri]|uniref:hypothetical protein n=1 Tax=Brucella ciceri TaxID=391287 RepID=UPI001F138C4E|nr:hypothetical protein [Brucella ciceri]MCH6203403.1 hypothetical protein [Brucella ciceri]